MEKNRRSMLKHAMRYGGIAGLIASVVVVADFYITENTTLSLLLWVILIGGISVAIRSWGKRSEVFPSFRSRWVLGIQTVVFSSLILACTFMMLFTANPKPFKDEIRRAIPYSIQILGNLEEVDTSLINFALSKLFQEQRKQLLTMPSSQRDSALWGLLSEEARQDKEKSLTFLKQASDFHEMVHIIRPYMLGFTYAFYGVFFALIVALIVRKRATYPTFGKENKI